MSLVVRDRILARLQPDRMWAQAPKRDFPPDILATMGVQFVVDAQCDLQEWHQNATYGVRRWQGEDDLNTFLVCDPDAPPAESLICSSAAVVRWIIAQTAPTARCSGRLWWATNSRKLSTHGVLLVLRSCQLVL